MAEENPSIPAPQAQYGLSPVLNVASSTAMVKAVAQSVALIVKKTYLVESRKGEEWTLTLYPWSQKRLNVPSYGPNTYPPCPNIPFASQYVSNGLGTAFFVAREYVVSAGHVVTQIQASGDRVDDYCVVLGFGQQADGSITRTFTRSQIHDIVTTVRYRDHKVDEDAMDYAVFRVRGRDSTRRPPVLRLAPRPPGHGEMVYGIGHPLGLPQKFWPGARVIPQGDHHLPSPVFTTLFSLPGASGAPVFNAAGQVVGIQWGSDDEDAVLGPNGNCWVVNNVGANPSQGTYFQRISGVLGPLHDLELQLLVGDTGLEADRYLEVSFGGTTGYHQLPSRQVDPGRLYRQPLDPAAFGLATIDAIRSVSLHSPPSGRRSWRLREVRLLVNGGQEVYRLTAEHTFPNTGPDDSATTWTKDLTTVPSPILIGQDRTFAGVLSASITPDPTVDEPEVDLLGTATDGHLLHCRVTQGNAVTWSDLGSPPSDLTPLATPFAGTTDEQGLVNAFAMRADGQVVAVLNEGGVCTWRDLGAPPPELGAGRRVGDLAAVSRPGGRIDVFWLTDRKQILRLWRANRAADSWNWYLVPHAFDLVGSLTATSRNREFLDVFAFDKGGRLVRATLDTQWRVALCDQADGPNITRNVPYRPAATAHYRDCDFLAVSYRYGDGVRQWAYRNGELSLSSLTPVTQSIPNESMGGALAAVGCPSGQLNLFCLGGAGSLLRYSKAPDGRVSWTDLGRPS